MMDKKMVSISKFLSLVLRHRPEHIGITLDENGWAGIAELIEGLNKNRDTPITLADIMYVVANNEKNRFALNEDSTKIRANQGHTIKVDLELEEDQPPTVLYHGTGEYALHSIMANGITSRKRLHVHLSDDVETAINVGKRRGKPVVLSIDAAKMHEDGFVFYLSANGVWLTDSVPVKYIMRP